MVLLKWCKHSVCMKPQPLAHGDGYLRKWASKDGTHGRLPKVVISIVAGTYPLRSASGLV
jgi:hypothetical protein